MRILKKYYDIGNLLFICTESEKKKQNNEVLQNIKTLKSKFIFKKKSEVLKQLSNAMEKTKNKNRK